MLVVLFGLYVSTQASEFPTPPSSGTAIASLGQAFLLLCNPAHSRSLISTTKESSVQASTFKIQCYLFTDTTLSHRAYSHISAAIVLQSSSIDAVSVRVPGGRMIPGSEK